METYSFWFCQSDRFSCLICSFNSRNSPDLRLHSALLVPCHKLNVDRSFTNFSFNGCASSPTLHLLLTATCSFLSLLLGILKRNLCFCLLSWFICKWGRYLNLAVALSSVMIDFRPAFFLLHAYQ